MKLIFVEPGIIGSRTGNYLVQLKRVTKRLKTNKRLESSGQDNYLRNQSTIKLQLIVDFCYSISIII